MKLHPVLAQVFDTLEGARVPWCLLRVPSNPAAPMGDVDLLIAPNETRRVRALLEELGFVALPGWASGDEMLFLRYDRNSDLWIWLDISTRVTFGPGHVLGTAAEVGILARRERQGSLVVPTADNGFWALLLHCLLDKQTVPQHYRARLQELAAGADTDSHLARLANRGCPAGWDATRLRDAARAGDWTSLEQIGPVVLESWMQHRSVLARLQTGLRDAWRLLRKPLLVPSRRGISVALLGANGAGKSTLATGLQTSFAFPVRQVYMGLWRSGDAGPAGWSIPGWNIATRPLLIWYRYLQAQYHQALGRLVVFDRYTYDALQPPRPPLVWLKRPYFWLLAHACPGPDLVLVLDTPGQVSFDRKGEYPPDELEDERRYYLSLQDRIPQVRIVDATQERDAVRGDAVEQIWRRYADRWRTTPAAARGARAHG